MRNPDVDAFASVDAGILFGHPSGIPVSSPHWDPDLLRAPWFHATQRPFAEVPEGYDGPRLFEEAKHSERYLLLTDGMGHADFTSYALVEERDPVMLYWGPRRGGEKERYEAVVRYLLNFFAGYLEENPAGLDFLRQEPTGGMSLERRKALPASPVYSDFLNALAAGDPEGALVLAADIRKYRPESPIHEEAVLNRLGYHFLMSWNMPEESIAVFRLNTEIHPQSVNVWDSLAEACWRSGDNENALKYVRKVLELDPENERAKRIEKELEAAPAP
jgi:tetratricopeptide (TPR) repeat protein